MIEFSPLGNLETTVIRFAEASYKLDMNPLSHLRKRFPFLKWKYAENDYQHNPKDSNLFVVVVNRDKSSGSINLLYPDM